MNINFNPVSPSSDIGDRTNNESNNASNCESNQSMDRAAYRSQSPNESKSLISLRSDYEQASLPEEFGNTYPESRLADRSKEDVEQKQDSDDTWFAFDLDEHLHGNDPIQPIQNYIVPNGAQMTAISEQFCDDPEKIYKSEDTEQQTYHHKHEAKFPDRSRTELDRNNLCEVEPLKENDLDDVLSDQLNEKNRIIKQLEDDKLKMAANMEALKNANKQQSEYIKQLLEKQRAAERNASSQSENQIKNLELDIKLLNVQLRMYKEDFLKEKMEKDLKQKTIESLSLQVQTLQDELRKATRKHTAVWETPAPSVFRNLEVDA